MGGTRGEGVGEEEEREGGSGKEGGGGGKEGEGEGRWGYSSRSDWREEGEYSLMVPMMGFQAFKRAVPISSGFLEKMGGEEGSWSGFE